MSKASLPKKLQFRFYSKPLFRTCEIIFNHAARVFEKGTNLSQETASEVLEQLNSKRMQSQRILNRIGSSHIQVCADCKGKCCGGVRERDAFTDRVLQDPSTSHRAARRKSGEMAAYKLMLDETGKVKYAANGTCVEGHCPELTNEGCRIPYELRPIQCTAYFCKPTVNELSAEECKIGVKALACLMGVQVKTAGLALKSRFGKN